MGNQSSSIVQKESWHKLVVQNLTIRFVGFQTTVVNSRFFGLDSLMMFVIWPQLDTPVVLGVVALVQRGLGMKRLRARTRAR
jgi:hypothetical protein